MNSKSLIYYLYRVPFSNQATPYNYSKNDVRFTDISIVKNEFDNNYKIFNDFIVYL